MRPIIGLLAEVDGELSTRVQNTYVKAIENAGGAPILFPYVNDGDTIDHLIGICDGFFFTGGMDIDPSRYGEKARENLGETQVNRDEFEFKVFDKIIKTGKPIIAICRGAQLVNVALGGTLYQDIPSEVDTEISHRQCEPKFAHSHDVKIIPDTPLYEMMGTERIKANSFHHQALKVLGKGLAVMAVADDGIIEAAYSTEMPYLRAYQWHPERLIETDATSRMIFEDFIRICIPQ